MHIHTYIDRSSGRAEASRDFCKDFGKAQARFFQYLFKDTLPSPDLLQFRME